MYFKGSVQQQMNWCGKVWFFRGQRLMAEFPIDQFKGMLEGFNF